MSDPALVVDALARRGDFTLAAAFSLAEGETLALAGPSGAGKTALLDVIAGLLRPSRGRVVCGGEVWCDAALGLHRPPETRRIGMVFQEYRLFPHLTVAQNVRFGGAARGRPRREVEATAQRWMERLGLVSLAQQPATRVSGGERQRVALARALASEPRLLLLDEPFGALDLRTRGVVRSELRAFLKETGLPTVVVTHDPVDALALGDRVAVLEEGRFSQTGTRDALLALPRTAFVASLAGLNFYPAEVAPGSGLKPARVGPVAFHVLADETAGRGFVAFAPSEVALSTLPQPGSPQNVFEGRVVEIFPLADRLRVVLEAGVTIVAEITHEASATLGLAPGRSVWAHIKATAIRVYE